MKLELDDLTSRRLCRRFAATNISSAPTYVMSIFQSSRLVSQVHMMAGQNVKRKYVMCHIPIKMLKKHVIPNSILHKLKIYSSKGCRKTIQRCWWIYVARYVAPYLANTAVLNIQVSAEDVASDYRISLRLVNSFSIDTDKYITQCATK